MADEIQGQGAEQPTEVRKVTKQTYKFLKGPGEKDKCPPQAKVILDTVKQANEKDGGASTRDNIIELLSDGRLTTVQTPERIFNFYRKSLVIEAKYLEEGITEVEEVVPASEVKAKKEKEAKEAKSPKTPVEQTEQTKAPVADAAAPAASATGTEVRGDQSKKSKKGEAVPA